LSGLVGALQGRADLPGDDTQLRADRDDAVSVTRDLVDIADHESGRAMALSNLANCLLARAGDNGRADIEEAVIRAAEAVEILPEQGQEWAQAMANRATALARLSILARQPIDAQSAIDCWLQIAARPTFGASIRIAAARDASEIAANTGHVEIAFDAARTTVELLPLLAWRGVSWAGRATHLTRWPGVAADATALALATGRAEQGILLADQGRGVLWGQLLDLRREVAALKDYAPDLAQRLIIVRTKLSE
jgi:hypothetical protein